LHPVTQTRQESRRPDFPQVNAATPVSRIKARVARQLLLSAASRLPLRIVHADSVLAGAGGPGSPTLVLHDPSRFFARAGGSGLVGFGESYQAGEWDSPDLPALLTVLAAELPRLVPAPLQTLRRWYDTARPRGERNTPSGARRNIGRHYDLSDDLFALFLDETMAYSSALFPLGLDGSPTATEANLADAQRRKIDRLLDLCDVRPRTRVLEIGSGWGELALRAAARGAHVTTVTLSKNQHATVRSRAEATGLQERIDVRLQDYRAVEGLHDAVLSVEMIEAVGQEHWPDYFGALRRLTAPGGRVGLQAITMPHDRMNASAGSQTWITKYIFPGGLIPSVEAITDHAEAAGLRIADDLAFGAHYAETLRLWRHRFNDRGAEVAALGFDETFQRTWNLYLAYSEAGFASRYLDVHQFVFDLTR
jgi:cyclopropane-fatty-acyl-phospholipid synthase